MTQGWGRPEWWIGAAVIAGFGWLVLGGDLEPPGPPAPTMKTLQEVEPRTPVQSLTGVGALYDITQAGSYYLAADVVVTSPTGSGILIASDDVSLDLNGYSVRHAGGSTGTGRGIWTTSPAGHRNVTIQNGHIDGFAGGGLWMQGTRGYITGVRISGCGNVGVAVGAGSVLRDVESFDNSNSGFSLTGPVIIESCSARNNGGAGWFIGGDAGSVMTDCIAAGNTLDGVFIGLDVDGMRVEGNHIVANGGSGIVSNGLGGVFVRNTLGGNGGASIATAPGNFVGTIVTTAADMNSAANALANIVSY